MRGIEEYNFPEFKKQAAWLRANNWRIFSPAERDEADPVIQELDVDMAGWQGSLGLDYFMAHDLRAVCETDAVILLKGWEGSQGARLESMVAVEVGHPVFEIVLRRTGEDGEIDQYTRGLESVDPARITAEFVAGSRGYDGLPSVKEYEQLEGAAFTADEWAEEERRMFDDHLDAEPYPTERDNPFAESWDEDQVTGEKAAFAAALDSLDSLEKKATAEFGPLFEPGTGTLPTDSADRKAVPIASGVLDYFPAALVEVARVSKAGNDKHNPGEPLHHARGKSTDHADSLLRHLVDRGKVDEETGQRHSAEVAWRALALLQQELEDEGLAPLARGARLP
jgi:hypothetical protein